MGVPGWYPGILIPLVAWILSSTADKVKLPVPCTDLVPIDILRTAVPSIQSVPPGVSIIYDRHNHVHAFTFSKDARGLSFMAEKVFRRCGFFPEEFSVFLVLKLKRRQRREVCVMSLFDTRTNHSVVSVTVSTRRVIFQYSNQTLRFQSVVLKDGHWHSIGFSLTGDTLVMTSDCHDRRKRHVHRVFPAFLPVGNTSFLIGKCRKSKPVFQGYIKDIILVPGADATYQACPPKVEPRPEMNNVVSTFPAFYNHGVFTPAGVECTWSDIGNLAFDTQSEQLKVCVNGIWQEVSIKTEKRKFDYLEEYQDIMLPANSIDVETFRIPKEGLFAVFSTANSPSRKRSYSSVFKWSKGGFQHYQNLATNAAQSATFFSIRKQFFLAVANYGSSPNTSSNSTIFRWHKKRKKFKRYQNLVTWTARDFEYFEIDGRHYLAVANYEKGDDTHINSYIYVWNWRKRKFEEHQKLMTIGAYDWTHFTVNGFHFLALANAFNGMSTLLYSVIYFWQDDKFVMFQTMETNGATDWEYFTINNDIFLAVANAFNYGPQNYQDVDTFYTNSTIYRLNIKKKIFEKFQVIPTYSAIDWEYFTVGGDHFLIVSNAQNGGADRQLHSVVYRWQGLDKFVPVHNLITLPTADWETFTVNDDVFLICANAKDTTSKVVKVKFT
ncbi:thrombospondin-type laminin G domain and EAR repeat-containing protein-like [Gigantopelta aegis]|uniref:thrombospondin-type laminin G domain and EAR repeat-containing protein-like n=1 Tax=Gigantopelta aegis TaxID=1735272 RepID=UPI001B88DFCF|nr:thrombospondin-type laminin G domain and EAR repeat-containing protein-like [Gigantopelta aegis]